MKTIVESKYFSYFVSFVILSVIAVVCYIVMKPFMIPALWGVIIGLTLIPPLNQITDRLEHLTAKHPFIDKLFEDRVKNLTAGIAISVLFLGSIFLFIFFANELFSDVDKLYRSHMGQTDLSGLVQKISGQASVFISGLPDYLASTEAKERWIERLNNSGELTQYVKKGITNILKLIWNKEDGDSDLAAMVITFLINFYIFILFTFGVVFSYPEKFIKNKFGKESIRKIMGFDIVKFFNDFKNIVELQINVVLENSILQGGVYFLALLISGDVPLHYCLFLGLLATFFTLLPAVGISLVVIPTFIVAFIYKNDLLMVLMIVTQVICFIDEWYLRQIYARPFTGILFRPFMGKNKMEGFDPKQYELPAVFYLISQIGAVSIFGMSGFVFGPILFMIIKVFIIELIESLE